jgi:hypothetical protein
MMNNFNKRKGKIFALGHLFITLILAGWAMADWFYLHPDESRYGVVPIPFLVVYAVYLILDFPISIVLVLLWGLLNQHIQGFVLESWQFALAGFLIFGTAWWYFLGGYSNKVLSIFFRKKV